jgi:hypothetical protein
MDSQSIPEMALHLPPNASQRSSHITSGQKSTSYAPQRSQPHSEWNQPTNDLNTFRQFEQKQQQLLQDATQNQMDNQTVATIEKQTSARIDELEKRRQNQESQQMLRSVPRPGGSQSCAFTPVEDQTQLGSAVGSVSQSNQNSIAYLEKILTRGQAKTNSQPTILNQSDISYKVAQEMNVS